jgi:predicted transcriptional regulator
MAETRQEFQQLARMRLQDARVLMRNGDFQGSYSGGYAVPSVQVKGLEKLRDLLERGMRIRLEIIERTIKDLAEKGDAAIPNLHLKHSELKRLGLA